RLAASLSGKETVETLCTEGNALYALGRDAEAVLAWKRALELDPDAVAPRIDMAARHFSRGDLDLARTVLKDALTGDRTRDRPVNFFLGNVAFRKEEFLNAEAHYNLAGDFLDAADRARVARARLEEIKKARERTQKEEE